MNKLGSLASATVIGMLAGPEGMNSSLGSLSAPDSSLAGPIDLEQMIPENVAAELVDHSLGRKYPSIYVYCDQITNALTEKFRTFSGHVGLVIEVRHSQDRLVGLQTALELYADSITQVLDSNRGDWGNGMYYSGGYQVTITPVKHGGRNFLQTAKVALQFRRVGTRMASYISSNANRFYTALESAYGSVPTITSGNRIPALKLTVQNQLEVSQRKDKTGSRTFVGVPTGGRHRTSFELRTYLTAANVATGPAYGPLFHAALGGGPIQYTGGTVAAADTAGKVAFTTPSNLTVGQGLSFSGEVRFVAAIIDPNTVRLNAPFTVVPTPGAQIEGAITYVAATELPSFSVFDYWSPSTAVQRLLSGAAVDEMDILVNGDYHEFHFRGLAQDVIDSSSFQAGGPSQLQAFPPEPDLGAFDYTIVPGNLGQAWLGTSPTQFFTITTATIQLKNSLETRAKEFGSNVPRAISPGQRTVTASFSLYGLDDSATAGLYQAARQQSPITVMFQLGEASNQIMAVNLKSVIPEVPEYDDSANRLQWKFRASRAQGTVDDEVTIAFA